MPAPALSRAPFRDSCQASQRPFSGFFRPFLDLILGSGFPTTRTSTDSQPLTPIYAYAYHPFLPPVFRSASLPFSFPFPSRFPCRRHPVFCLTNGLSRKNSLKRNKDRQHQRTKSQNRPKMRQRPLCRTSGLYRNGQNGARIHILPLRPWQPSG